MAQGYFVQVSNPRAKHGPFSTMKKARAFAQRIADKLGRSVKIIFGASKAKGSATKRSNSAKSRIPGFDAWDTFGGGTGAPDGTYSYSITAPSGKKYSVSPSSPDGSKRRLVYIVTVWPNMHGSGHGWVNKDGTENMTGRIHGIRLLRDALKAVRVHDSKSHHEVSRTNPNVTGDVKLQSNGVLVVTTAKGVRALDLNPRGRSMFSGYGDRGPSGGGSGSSWMDEDQRGIATQAYNDVELFLKGLSKQTLADIVTVVGGTAYAQEKLTSLKSTAHNLLYSKIIVPTRGTYSRSNPARGPRGEVDEHLASDLVLSIENYGELHGQFNSIRLNLLKKMRKGKYDHSKAPKLFRYLVDRGAQIYAKDGGLPKNSINVPTRDAAARELADSFAEQAKGGEYDHLLTAGHDSFAWGPQRSNSAGSGAVRANPRLDEGMKQTFDELVYTFDHADLAGQKTAARLILGALKNHPGLKARLPSNAFLNAVKGVLGPYEQSFTIGRPEHKRNPPSRVLDHYITTALWSSNDESDDSGGEPMDKNYSESDLAPETRERMHKDVDSFFSKVEAQGIDTSELSDERMVHDFWLTRNGHGAGFWDGDYPEPQATQLTKLSKTFGEVSLYVGDDGMIYQYGGRQNPKRRRGGKRKNGGDWVTVADLEEVGGNSLHGTEDLAGLVAELNGARTQRAMNDAFQHADKVLGTHGVEAIWGPNDSMHPIAQYLNTGDTYAVTLVNPMKGAHPQNQVLVTTWGDWLEKWERDNGETVPNPARANPKKRLPLGSNNHFVDHVRSPDGKSYLDVFVVIGPDGKEYAGYYNVQDGYGPRGGLSGEQMAYREASRRGGYNTPDNRVLRSLYPFGEARVFPVEVGPDNRGPSVTLPPKRSNSARTNARPGSAKSDKAVIAAFVEQRALEGHKLTTDGSRIDGNWMGGSGIAAWEPRPEDRDSPHPRYIIEFRDLGSKAAETVQRAIRKAAPKNDLAEGWTRGSKKNPTTGQVSAKQYRCIYCGHEYSASTNHYGNIYSACPACAWKRPVAYNAHESECIEQMPAGMTKPAPWTQTTVAALMKGSKKKKTNGGGAWTLVVSGGKYRGRYDFATAEDALSAAGDHTSFGAGRKAEALALLHAGRPFSNSSSAGSISILPPSSTRRPAKRKTSNKGTRKAGAYASFVKAQMPRFKHLAPKARMSAIAREWREKKAMN